MDKMKILDRIKLVKPGFDDDVILEVVTVVSDRIKLRLLPLAIDKFPNELGSIVVSVANAELNRKEHDNEGVKSESISGWSISFIDDMLSIYENDINLYKNHHMKEQGLIDEEKNRSTGLRWF